MVTEIKVMMSIVEREKATRVILGLQRGYRVILSLCDVNYVGSSILAYHLILKLLEE